VRIYVCAYVCVCLHVCLYVCVCIYLCAYVRVHVFVRARVSPGAAADAQQFMAAGDFARR